MGCAVSAPSYRRVPATPNPSAVSDTAGAISTATDARGDDEDETSNDGAEEIVGPDERGRAEEGRAEAAALNRRLDEAERRMRAVSTTLDACVLAWRADNAHISDAKTMGAKLSVFLATVANRGSIGGGDHKQGNGDRKNADGDPRTRWSPEEAAAGYERLARLASDDSAPVGDPDPRTHDSVALGLNLNILFIHDEAAMPDRACLAALIRGAWPSAN